MLTQKRSERIEANTTVKVHDYQCKNRDANTYEVNADSRNGDKFGPGL